MTGGTSNCPNNFNVFQKLLEPDVNLRLSSSLYFFFFSHSKRKLSPWQPVTAAQPTGSQRGHTRVYSHIIHHAPAGCSPADDTVSLSLVHFSLNDTSHPSVMGRAQVCDPDFTWDSGAEEVEEFSVLGVHDGSLDELHHRVATVLKLGVTPQAERPCRRRIFYLSGVASTTTPTPTLKHLCDRRKHVTCQLFPCKAFCQTLSYMSA